jgi:hypothetical protein
VPPMPLSRHWRRLAVAFLALAMAMALALAARAAAAANTVPAGRTVVLQRGAHAHSVTVTTSAAGEALLGLTASAPGADWSKPGKESAVVSIQVDGRYASDLVIGSAAPTSYKLALGHLDGGRHRLAFSFAGDRSPAGAQRAVLQALRVELVTPGDAGYTALRHAPVVYGRTLAELGGPFQNATTDTPLVAWHEESAATAPGHKVLEYSLVWSNEDGGTDTPALMARWGRSTDIEWIYHLEVDENGNRVPGTAVYQAPNHETLPFAGTFEGDHPLLETCTSNNNMCDKVDGPMRFFLAADQTRPVDRAREQLMDVNPWTYQVMAKELQREGKIEQPSSPSTPAVGDQRTYLYIEVDKDTANPRQMGLTVGVRLRGDPTLYRSDHGEPSWSVERDVPAATTVELPAGTTPADIAQVIAIRQPMSNPDTGASETVTAVNRTFFLDQDYLPQQSFFSWHETPVTLTPTQPEFTLFSA